MSSLMTNSFLLLAVNLLHYLTICTLTIFNKKMSNLTSVTEISITPIRPRDGLTAFASFVLDDKYFVAGVAIFTKLSGGFRLVFPTRKIGQTNLNLFNPIKREVGEIIERKVSEELTKLYDRQLTEYKT